MWGVGWGVGCEVWGGGREQDLFCLNSSPPRCDGDCLLPSTFRTRNSEDGGGGELEHSSPGAGGKQRLLSAAVRAIV